MDACQPTQLMTITNFVIVISWCAQSNLLICRLVCSRWPAWPGTCSRCGCGRPRDPRLGTPPWPDAVARGKDAFLGAAVSLGLAAAAAGTEIGQLSLLLNETGYHGLVHGDACPDNVRFLDGRCRIFDFEHSGWGTVVLDASYLLAPFPSCWCFGRLPPQWLRPPCRPTAAVSRRRASTSDLRGMQP